MLFFQWFRTAIKNAFLSGIQDALDHLDAKVAEQPADEPRLQLSLQVTVPEKRLKGGKQ